MKKWFVKTLQKPCDMTPPDCKKIFTKDTRMSNIGEQQPNEFVFWLEHQVEMKTNCTMFTTDLRAQNEIVVCNSSVVSRSRDALSSNAEYSLTDKNAS